MNALVLSPALLLCVPHAALVQDLQANRATLRGLESIYLAVEQLDPDARSQGLAEAGIASRSEERLRKAGIELRSRNEQEVSPDKSFLYIRLSSLRRGSCIGFSVHVALRQEVLLVREPGLSLLTETWSVGGVGEAEPGKFKQAALDSIDDFVDRFIRAIQQSRQADSETKPR